MTLQRATDFIRTPLLRCLMTPETRKRGRRRVMYHKTWVINNSVVVMKTTDSLCSVLFSPRMSQMLICLIACFTLRPLVSRALDLFFCFLLHRHKETCDPLLPCFCYVYRCVCECVCVFPATIRLPSPQALAASPAPYGRTK